MTMNRNLSTTLFAVLCTALLATQFCFAQGQKQFATQGVTELGGDFTFVSVTPVVNGVSGNNVTVVSLNPTIGYFVSDNWEVGADPFGLTFISGGGGSQVSLLFFGAYNFKTESAGFPFVEGLLGYTSESDGSSRNGLSWGVRGGIKAPIAGQALVNIAGEYLQVTLDPSNSTNRWGYNQFSIVTGLSIWL